MNSIHQQLYDHLSGDGTPNDNTTAELYRKAHRLPDDYETDLETVEHWAFEVLNAKRAREYWAAVCATS